MNRLIKVHAPLVTLMEWCRSAGVPALLYVPRLNYNPELKTIGSRRILARYSKFSRISRSYRIIVRDRDFDLLTLYVGSVEVVR
jgi:hypothetical protein